MSGCRAVWNIPSRNRYMPQTRKALIGTRPQKVITAPSWTCRPGLLFGFENASAVIVPNAADPTVEFG